MGSKILSTIFARFCIHFTHRVISSLMFQPCQNLFSTFWLCRGRMSRKALLSSSGIHSDPRDVYVTSRRLLFDTSIDKILLRIKPNTFNRNKFWFACSHKAIYDIIFRLKSFVFISSGLGVSDLMNPWILRHIHSPTD